MFVELIDCLRCLRPHEESWLVASAERTEDRDIVEGVLGCPICQAEHAIKRGVALFTERPCLARAQPPDETEATRLAAFLDLAEPRGYVLLVGALGSHARLVQRLTAAHLLLVNPPDDIDVRDGLSGLTTEGRLPLAAGSAHAAALDRSATDEMIRSAVAVLRPGGRLVAPVSFDVPVGANELVRDQRVWIAERIESTTPTRPIALQRNRT